MALRFENTGLGPSLFWCSVSVCFPRKCRGRKEN